MRAFLAIDVPEKIQSYLFTLQKKMNFGTLSYAKQFHITLKFLDEINEKQKDEIVEKISKIDFPKFSGNVSQIDYFANGKDIKVVWVAANPKKEFNELVKLIDENLNGMFQKDDFVPHITLARIKFLPDRNKFLDNLKKIKTEEMKFEVDKFFLKKSILTGNGPVYDNLKEFELI